MRLPDGSRLSEGHTERLDLKETLHIERGTVRTVRATVPYSNMDNRFNPPTTYRVVSGGDRLALAGGNSNLGEAVIEARREGDAVLAWEITDPRPLPGIARSGRIAVRVSRPTSLIGGGLPGSVGSGGGGDWIVPDPSYPDAPTIEGRADEVVRGLYRGILLREPDPGAAGYVEQIRRSGWNGLAEVTRMIANSEESVRGVYSLPGVTDQRRVITLYAELLGLADNTVPIADFQSALDLFRDHRYDVVAQQLIRRPEFRQRFGITVN